MGHWFGLIVALTKIAHVDDRRAWSMPYAYAMALLDQAAEEREAEGGGERGTGRRSRRDPFVTADGHALPPGMSEMARLMSRFSAVKGQV